MISIDFGPLERSEKPPGVYQPRHAPASPREVTRRSAADQICDVADRDQDDQDNQDHEAGQVDERLSLGRQAPAPHRLHDRDGDPAAIKGREGKDVEDCQVDR